MRASLGPVVLAAAVLLLLPACGGDGDEGGEPEPSPAPATTTAAESGDQEVYEVESAGFAIAVPESWNAASVDDFRESGALEQAAEENPDLAPMLEALARPDSIMKFIAGDPELRKDFATNVNVIREELPAGMDQEGDEAANLANIGQALRVEGDIEEERVDVEAGEALRIAYEHGITQGGEERRFAVVQYIVAREGEGYVITYTTVPDALAGYEPQFDESARSFRFL